jgi:hypothetical protein
MAGGFAIDRCALISVISQHCSRCTSAAVAHDLASAIAESGLAEEQRATAEEVAAVFSLSGALLKKNVMVRSRKANTGAPVAALTAAAATAGRFGSTGGAVSEDSTRQRCPPPAPQATKPIAAARESLRQALCGYRCGGRGVALFRRTCLTPPFLFQLDARRAKLIAAGHGRKRCWVQHSV